MDIRSVLLRGAFDSVSGYGNDGCGIAKTMDQLGYEVHISPFQVTPPIPAEVARLLTQFPLPHFDAFLMHADPAASELQDGLRRAADLTVFWTMWEYESFDPEFAEMVARYISNYDVVMSYDDVTAGALAPLMSNGTKHLTLQGGFESEEWPYQSERNWDGTFRFCMVGQLHERKDPFAAIQAFARLKAEHGEDFDAELHLKTNIPGLHSSLEQAYPGVKVYYAWWPQPRLLDFYAHCHAYVASSRGEGKNVPALEAQATGIPVIGTNWGGHRVWMREEYAYPVNWTRYVTPQGLAAVQVDRDHLAEQMWRAYSNRGEAKVKGELASRTIPAMCDWESVLLRWREMLARV